MKLYLISQSTVTGWDTYDSAVVCAESLADAANIHPGGPLYDDIGARGWLGWLDRTWTSNPTDVHVKYLGRAVRGEPRGVICASFNAG